MPRRRPPHIRREVTRHGARVWYFRRDGKRIRLPDEYGTQEFWDAYHAALTGHKMPERKAPLGHGTVAWLVTEYKASAKWRALALSTQGVRTNLLKRLVAKAGTIQVKTLTRVHVQRGMDDRADKPEAANAWLKTIRQLLDFALDRGIVDQNVAKTIKTLRPTRKGGHKTWTPAEVDTFERHWPVGTKQRLAFDLLLYTGLRRADVARIGRQHIRGDVLEIVPQKTARTTGVTVHQRLPQALLDSIRATTLTGTEALVVTDYGRPFTAAGFGNWFREICDAAGVPGSAHGLRKAGAVRAAEAGATTQELMALFGWVNIDEAELYTRAADRKRLALRAEGKMAR
jgi:integrase